MPFALGIDASGNYGYIKAGADTVTPFRSQADIDSAYASGVAATKKGTAKAAQVLSGYTFTSADGVGQPGSMTNRGAWTGAATGSGNVAIPAGYHNGSGYVSGSGAYNAGYNAGKTAATATTAVELTSGGGKYHSDYGVSKTYSYTLPAAEYKAYMVVASSPQTESHAAQRMLSSMSVSGQTDTLLSDVKNAIGVVIIKANKSSEITINLGTNGFGEAGYFYLYYRIFGLK